ncbi:tumor necrosis factor receptor superfamily member 18-like [Scleropages formosus]|uniref:tumor necrosis factor receptor superfamily member 18-like n=1 Tax=Scleropages formosus TaxID=113540 RepID=UPI0010FABAFE|nr:tumor necrosis factor receptor superfamily member 18 [Scleropages formosus]
MPVCGRGEELQKQGSFDYHYTCVQCPNNTYSDTVGGICKQLAQCNQLGLQVISPGNSTHNTKCGCSRHETNRYEIPAVHLTVIILLLFILHLCSCLMGQYCRHNKQIGSMMPAAGRADRRCRCPLSEEEKGDFPGQLIDNKSNSNYEPSSFEQSQKSML